MKSALRKAFRVFCITLLILFLLSLFGPLLGGPILVMFHLLFGWLFYLREVVPAVTVFWPSIITGILAFFFVLVGLHSAIKWYKKNKSDVAPESGDAWKFRWSAAVALLVLIAFVAGMAMTGLIHQLYWLSRDGALFTPQRGYMGYSCINNLRMIDAGKEQAALANKWPAGTDCDSTTNRIIINRYIKGDTTPQCRMDGTYTYNPIGTNPVCSVQDPIPHAMPSGT